MKDNRALVQVLNNQLTMMQALWKLLIRCKSSRGKTTGRTLAQLERRIRRTENLIISMCTEAERR